MPYIGNSKTMRMPKSRRKDSDASDDACGDSASERSDIAERAKEAGYLSGAARRAGTASPRGSASRCAAK